MKNLTKIIFASAAMFVAVSATAQIRIVQSDYIEEKVPMELKTTRDNVTVAFDMILENKVVKTDEAYVLTPQFIRDGVVVKALPSVVVEGRKYSLIAREKRNFDKSAVIPYDKNEIYELIPYRKGDVELHYQMRIPYDPQLKGALLVLSRKTYVACGIGTGKKDKNTGLRPGGLTPVKTNSIVLASGVTDYSDLRRNNQVAYYYPNRVLGEYRNNFSNSSVFRIDSKVIDMDAFVRYGYTDFKAEIEKLLSNNDVKLHRIVVNTSASPEGSLKHNKDLAETRANVISKYLVKNLDLPANLIEKQWVDENWDAFMQDLNRSNLSNKDEIRRIVNSTGDLDLREKELRKLNNWNEIFKVFQNLRNCHIEVFYSDREHYAEEVMFGGRILAVVEVSGKPVVSLEKTTEYYKADPKSVTNLNNMMVALIEAGRYKDAESYALQIPNRDILPVIANNKGVLYSLLGERKMARTMFELAKDVPMVDYNVGLLNLADENYTDAADMLNGYNVSNSAAANLDAERNAAAARNTHINDVTAHNYYMRAIAYVNEGEDKLAVGAIEKAIELDPSYRNKALNQAEFIGLRSNEQFAALTGSKVVSGAPEYVSMPSVANEKAVAKAEKRAAANAAKAEKAAEKEAARAAKKAAAEMEKAEKEAAKVASQAVVETSAAEREASMAAERAASEAARAAAAETAAAEREAARVEKIATADEAAATKAAAKAEKLAAAEAAAAEKAAARAAEKAAADAAKTEKLAAAEAAAAEKAAARAAEKVAAEAAKAEKAAAAEAAAAEKAAARVAEKAAADAAKAEKAAAAERAAADKAAARAAEKAAADAAKAEKAAAKAAAKATDN